MEIIIGVEIYKFLLLFGQPTTSSPAFGSSG